MEFIVRGFPFNLSDEDMMYINMQDLYRSYQFLKMYLKKTIENKTMRKNVLSTLKSVYRINFNKSVYFDGQQQKGYSLEMAKQISNRFHNSKQVEAQIKQLIKLKYSLEEIQVRLLLNDEIINRVREVTENDQSRDHHPTQQRQHVSETVVKEQNE